MEYNEFKDSQLPAINLLRKLDYKWLDEDENVKQRENILSNVLLEDILFKQLKSINSFEFKGETFNFSAGNIRAAVNALKNIPDEGLVKTNEKIYDLITLGKSYTENIYGDQKSFTIKYIDWGNFENNVFHITEEFVVEGPKDTRRPDIVLFVNGIPFVVIENKRRDKNLSIDEGISQHIRNQTKSEGIPRLFHYAQLLLSVQPNEVKYAVTGTAAKFWSLWKEKVDSDVEKIIKKKINDVEAEDRLPTAQDSALYSLCRPERLMELVYKYIVFDGPIKKIARYQQYFAVQESLNRVRQYEKDGKRRGGVIWHTQGSGKSLTMVMLSKALALDKAIQNPRVVIVTDRINLDKQIFKTFNNCGKNVRKARSGKNLISLIKDKGIEIITSIIDKFDLAYRQRIIISDSTNIFVLVDESHRGQFGEAHAKMKIMLPNACYIGFTGTPLMKKEKSTARKFGGFIHTYTIDQAVADKAVVPLLYEGRSAKLNINKYQIDKGFDRLAEPLSKYAAKDLKMKFSTITQIFESEQVVDEIAYDISKHFTKNWQGTGFKAQLAVPKINTAIRYQRYFEDQTNPDLKINTAVVFTPPDSRQDHDDVWDDPKGEGMRYWKKILEKYHSQDEYEDYIISKFKEEDNEVEIIIVVSKLLVGFDAPRNTVLYLAKPLREHGLLQAIARVNRVFEGKEFGYIIDYVGILGKLDEALTEYSALKGYEEEDLTLTVTDVRDEIRKVPIRHADVWRVFDDVNREDNEALERHLGEKDIRDKFYEALSAYARTLQTALAADEFYEMYDDGKITYYKQQLKLFQSLRTSVQQRYAEVISYKEYESRVRKLLDTHIQAEGVDKITKTVNVFDKELRQEELLNTGKTPASVADQIAHEMKKTITENMEKDEAFFRKFSELIEETIRLFNEGRLEEKEYLEHIMGIQKDFSSGHQEGIPDSVKDDPKARAFFGAIKSLVEDKLGKEEAAQHNERMAQAGKDIAKIIKSMIIRDWKKNMDVQKQMENALEDYLYEHKNDFGYPMTFKDIDEILPKCMKVAINNY
jgi:type I restriction enzyme, R subunit